MFDYYLPEIEQCPLCGHPLSEWQGKDGPNALFEWRQGIRHPTHQHVEDEVKISEVERNNLTLPEKFQIYSHDCPEHSPIVATGVCSHGVWLSTVLEE